LPTIWIHGGFIPPCPCGAPPEDQVRRYSGGAEIRWFCVVCGLFRGPPDGWDDPLVPIELEDWRAQSRVLSARARARWERS
jgi:hypothetical protein